MFSNIYLSLISELIYRIGALSDHQVRTYIFLGFFAICCDQCRPSHVSEKTPEMQSISYLTNSLYAEFFSGKINMRLQFISFLHTDITQLVKILSRVRQEITYSTLSITWVLMTWWHKEPGHQQPWYLLCWTELILSPHVKGYLTGTLEMWQ